MNIAPFFPQIITQYCIFFLKLYVKNLARTKIEILTFHPPVKLIINIHFNRSVILMSKLVFDGSTGSFSIKESALSFFYKNRKMIIKSTQKCVCTTCTSRFNFHLVHQSECSKLAPIAGYQLHLKVSIAVIHQFGDICSADG